MLASVHIPTASRLQDYVTHIWEFASQGDGKEAILPEGIVEIIFNFSDAARALLPGCAATLQPPRCFIQGMRTGLLQVEYSGCHLFGVRLHPHCIKDLLGILPAELTNESVDLASFRPLFNSLWHQLSECNSFSEKIAVLEANLPVLAARDCGRSRALSQLFLNNSTTGFQNVNELAREIYYSTRQLNRMVNELYGISAEELTTYKKFVESVKRIHVDTLSLTQVAYEAGFYDQAHFCRVFKSFAALTPKQYRKQKSLQPFHIFS